MQAAVRALGDALLFVHREAIGIEVPGERKMDVVLAAPPDDLWMDRGVQRLFQLFNPSIEPIETDAYLVGVCHGSWGRCRCSTWSFDQRLRRDMAVGTL